MKEVRQTINEYKLPTYIEDILTHNYCPNFLRMSMVREDNDYIFSYQTERFEKIDISKLNTYDKMVLLRTIISLNDENEDWLVKAENYMLEPELVYSLNNNVEEGCIRLLFYPDFKRTTFQKKIMQFAEKIKNKRNKMEVDMIENFKSICEMSDWNRTRLYLDKNIMRMRNRAEYKS
ncbi:MAG: hypothetical protein KBS56_00805 [Clostridiales bacterium]|nr:hypothetical protein [Candidatus Crickella equi]